MGGVPKIVYEYYSALSVLVDVLISWYIRGRITCTINFWSPNPKFYCSRGAFNLILQTTMYTRQLEVLRCLG